MVAQPQNDLASWFDEQIEQAKDYLGGDCCESFDEYRYVCGQIRGLRNAQAEWARLVGEGEEE